MWWWLSRSCNCHSMRWCSIFYSYCGVSLCNWLCQAWLIISLTSLLVWNESLEIPHMEWPYSQIHPALQQIPTHSTLELCLWWLALIRDITLGLVNWPNDISLSRASQSQAKFKSAVGRILMQSWLNLTIVDTGPECQVIANTMSDPLIILVNLEGADCWVVENSLSLDYQTALKFQNLDFLGSSYLEHC